jgi:hypothetical protein
MAEVKIMLRGAKGAVNPRASRGRIVRKGMSGKNTSLDSPEDGIFGDIRPGAPNPALEPGNLQSFPYTLAGRPHLEQLHEPNKNEWIVCARGIDSGDNGHILRESAGR